MAEVNYYVWHKGVLPETKPEFELALVQINQLMNPVLVYWNERTWCWVYDAIGELSQRPIFQGMKAFLPEQCLMYMPIKRGWAVE